MVFFLAELKYSYWFLEIYVKKFITANKILLMSNNWYK